MRTNGARLVLPYYSRERKQRKRRKRGCLYAENYLSAVRRSL